MFTIEYNFQPSDEVYVIDRTDDSIKHGVVCQFEGDVYPDENKDNTTRQIYLVRFDGDSGTTEALSTDVFGTLNEAILALSSEFAPTPTPTVTPTFTVTPGITAT